MTVLAIIVTYRRLPVESLSLMTLVESAKHLQDSELRLKVMIADNTPEGKISPGCPRR